MGELLYGPACTSIAFDDRTLRHLQFVIVSKLRRGETFVFSWGTHDHDIVMNSLWCSPSLFLEFRYSGEATALNKRWVEALALEAAGPRGLTIVPEPSEESVLAASSRA